MNVRASAKAAGTPKAAVRCPDFIPRHRNHIECMWARLKEWRAVAARYEKTAAAFMGSLCLAASTDWIKS